MEFWDDYDHDNPTLTYILESTKTEEIREQFKEQLEGCDCEEDCKENCSCVARSGTTYTFSNKQKLESYRIRFRDQQKPTYECNNNCKCCEVLCGNKLVQLGPRKGLSIFKTPDRGCGLKTINLIQPGSFICEYAGEVLSQNAAKNRFKEYKQINLTDNYIFCINENFGENNVRTFIDPTFFGNIGRYINHSCQPNCDLFPIRVNDLLPKLCIFARNLIGKEEEITFDYGEVTEIELNDKNNYKCCLCRAQNCRKYLPFDSTIYDLPRICKTPGDRRKGILCSSFECL